MMNRKTITLTVLALASSFQNMYAMGGARTFAKKVLWSKTAAVASAVFTWNTYSFYKEGKELDARSQDVSLPAEKQQEIMQLFAGKVKQIKMDTKYPTTPLFVKDDALYLSKDEQAAFLAGSASPLKEEQVMAAAKYQKTLLDQDPVVVPFISFHRVPVSLLFGKVAGVAKLFPASVATCLALVGIVQLSKRFENVKEERSKDMLSGIDGYNYGKYCVANVDNQVENIVQKVEDIVKEPLRLRVSEDVYSKIRNGLKESLYEEAQTVAKQRATVFEEKYDQERREAFMKVYKPENNENTK